MYSGGAGLKAVQANRRPGCPPTPPAAAAEMFSFVPSAITQPFFELQTPDFAWEPLWNVPTI